MIFHDNYDVVTVQNAPLKYRAKTIFCLILPLH